MVFKNFNDSATLFNSAEWRAREMQAMPDEKRFPKFKAFLPIATNVIATVISEEYAPHDAALMCVLGNIIDRSHQGSDVEKDDMMVCASLLLNHEYGARITDVYQRTPAGRDAGERIHAQIAAIEGVISQKGNIEDVSDVPFDHLSGITTQNDFIAMMCMVDLYNVTNSLTEIHASGQMKDMDGWMKAIGESGGAVMMMSAQSGNPKLKELASILGSDAAKISAKWIDALQDSGSGNAMENLGFDVPFFSGKKGSGGGMGMN